MDDADLSLSRTLQPRGNWRTTHLRNQHSQQNLTPSLHRTLRRLWTHLPQLLIWPSPPLRDMTTFRGRPQANLAFKCATTHATHPAPTSALSSLPRSLGKRTNHAIFWTFIHCPYYPTRTIPPAIWPPYHESTHSPASQLISQHCPRSPRS